MRIGLMLRAFDEKGGIGVYTRNLVSELLCLDHKNQYILFFRYAHNLGRFAHHDNASERLVKAPNKAVWDQIAIPLACWKEKVDVVVHPKFTIPLLAPCKTVMVVHGADWFFPDQAQFYTSLDVRYIRTVMPLYFRKSTAVISVSQITTENFRKALNLPAEKIKTIYFGPAKHFKRVTDPAVLKEAKAKYQLPDRFILTLTKRDGGEKRKNLRQVFNAYALYHKRAARPHCLVVGGKDSNLFKHDYQIPDEGYGRDIIFAGYVDQSDLPAVYSMADLYLYPSNLEAFPIPLTEAMACGTPIVTSNVNGLLEIAGDAAIVVDPQNTKEIAGAMCRVLSDSNLRATLSAKGLARSQKFTWDACAKETLALLESLAP
jgi:glycosyltransferase involved in cell wall biosynthesis